MPFVDDPRATFFSTVALPNGAILQNRIAKAAMEENLAARCQVPGADILRLYETLGRGDPPGDHDPEQGPRPR